MPGDGAGLEGAPLNAPAVTALANIPAHEMSMQLVMGYWSLDVRVKYLINYPSPWHRDSGVDGEIDVLSVTYEDGTVRKSLPMLPGMLDSIHLAIESRELEVN